MEGLEALSRGKAVPVASYDTTLAKAVAIKSRLSELLWEVDDAAHAARRGDPLADGRGLRAKADLAAYVASLTA